MESDANDIELHILHTYIHYNYLQIYILTFFKLVSQFAIVRSLPWLLLLLLLLLLVSPQRCREILILEDTQHAICKRYAGNPYARQGRPTNGEWLQRTELVALCSCHRLPLPSAFLLLLFPAAPPPVVRQVVDVNRCGTLE